MTSPAPAPLKTLLAVAHDLADQSGKAILPHFRKVITVDDKGGRVFDPVTAADRAAERIITKTIRNRLPDHGVIGEEFGIELPDARFRWVIDPIDGTRSFITGTPMWGTLIGLLDHNEPILGLIDQPFTGERAWAVRGGAFARRNKEAKARRIKTRPCPRLSDAFLMSTSPDLFAPGFELESFLKVKAQARMTRFGGDCYAYLLLASGFIDVIIEAGLKTHDVVALIPIIEAAGGCITTWEGKPYTDGGRIVASGDPALHERVLKLLRSK